MKALIRLTPDVTTKAPGTRKRFTRRVADNLRRALDTAGFEAEVRWTLARLYLECDDPLALAVARRTFGVHSVSPCREEPIRDLDHLVQLGTEQMRDRVRGRTFAVRAKVRDGSLGFKSADVNQRLGAALNEFAEVNLDRPDVTVHVEVRDNTAWFFDRVLEGEGGLPLGVGGRAVTLLSGGFDSAVASYLMMRRGIAPVYVCMRLGGEPHERAMLAVANQLAIRWCQGHPVQLAMVPLEETVERLRAEVPPRMWQLVLKRLMYRAAEAAARRTRADALLTGESVGQVSSQTLPNLRALEAPGHYPVLRPLLAYDKESIVRLARHVGTHDLSARVPEYCALAAEKPATSANVGQLAEAEARVPFDADAAIDSAAWFDLPTSGDLGDDVRAERVPDGAAILDLRSPPARRQRNIPDALPVEPLDVIDRPETLDATVPYAVVCDVGARSAWFARRLRELGFRAWSLPAENAADAS